MEERDRDLYRRAIKLNEQDSFKMRYANADK
jgi:hypothetical protein